MGNSVTVLKFVQDNLLLVVTVCLGGIALLAWGLIEAFRTERHHEEMLRLRERLYLLEREGTSGARFRPDPLVLSRRWIRSGGAATTLDGGCLVYIERVLPQQNRAMLTIRVDGFAVQQGYALRTGDTFEVEGKSGIYVLQMAGVDGIQASLQIALRSKHLAPDADDVD